MSTKLAEYLAQHPRGKRGEIASEWGISEAYLSQLASGVRRPSLSMAFKIEKMTNGAVPARSWEAAA